MLNNFLNYIILFIVVLICDQINAASFVLDGTIINFGGQETTIFIGYTKMQNGKYVHVEDSTNIIDGNFSFKGDIEDLTAARLDFSNRFIRIYIEPGQMSLYIDGDAPYNYHMVGPKVENENIEFREQLRPYMELYFKLLDKVMDLSNKIDYVKEDSIAQDSIFQIINEVANANETNHSKMDSLYLDFVLTHPSYQIAPDLLYSISESSYVDIDSIRSAYNRLAENVRNTIIGKIALKEIEAQERKRIETSSISEFILKTASGRTIKLSDYKNKTYVLLDFWASWCAPCLKEIPKMKEIYGTYKDKELAIIGISLDKDKNSWNETIQEKGLNHWPQTLDSEVEIVGRDYSGNGLSVFLGCEAIPFYVLLDKEGKIVAKWKYIGNDQLNELDKILEDN